MSQVLKLLGVKFCLTIGRKLENKHMKHFHFCCYRFVIDLKLQAYLFFLLSRGYSAPEYAIRGELSEKADIYSFGVLVLEIISSRKNTDLNLPSEMQYLPDYVRSYLSRAT